MYKTNKYMHNLLPLDNLHIIIDVIIIENPLKYVHKIEIFP